MKKKLSLAVTIISLLGTCYPILYMVENPETTQMQLLLKFKYLYLFCAIGVYYGRKGIYSKEKY